MFTAITQPTKSFTQILSPVEQYKKEAAVSLSKSQEANSAGGILKDMLGQYVSGTQAIAKGANDLPPAIIKGAAEFALSAGEFLPRLLQTRAGNPTTNKILAPTNVPIVSDIVGPIQSTQSKYNQAIADGQTGFRPIANAFLDTAVNEPIGFAIKPLALGGAVALKAFQKLAGTKTLDGVIKILNYSFPELTPKQIQTIAPRVVETSEPKVIEQIVKNEQTVAKTTTAEKALAVDRSIPEEMRTRLEEARIQRDILEESASNHPGKELAKYRSSQTGDLPEVAAGKTSKFGTKGDEIAQEVLGQGYGGDVHGGDLHIAQQALEEYTTLRNQAREANDLYQSIKKEIADFRKKAPERAAENASLQRVADTATPQELGQGQRLTPVQGTGETKARGLSKGIAEKAIDQNLAKKVNGVQKYKTISKADQLEKAKQLVASNYEQAKRIALGLEDAPEGMLPEFVLVELEKEAIQRGDIELLRQLVRESSLAGEATTMGQRIGALAERDPDSPVKAMQEIMQARAERYGNSVEKAKRRVIGDIRQEIARTTNPKTWGEFVDSITC